jgi:hypothetical protein
MSLPVTNHRVTAFVRALMRSSGCRFWWTLALIMMLSLTAGAGLALLLPTLETAGLDLNDQGQVRLIIWRGCSGVLLRRWGPSRV